MDGSCPLVSVIIPVYNSENYVEACIGSVVNQSYKNLEIFQGFSFLCIVKCS